MFKIKTCQRNYFYISTTTPQTATSYSLASKNPAKKDNQGHVMPIMHNTSWNQIIIRSTYI